MRGRVLKFGDNIDTDIIAPPDAISFGIADESEMQGVIECAFHTIRPGFHKNVRSGDILIAGKNFGLGSHREQATTVIAKLGISTILAESIARLYQRNSIAIGFPVFEVPGISKLAEEGDDIEVDLTEWKVTNMKTGETLRLQPLSGMIQNILDAGGILKMMVQRLEQEGVSQ